MFTLTSPTARFISFDQVTQEFPEAAAAAEIYYKEQIENGHEVASPCDRKWYLEYNKKSRNLPGYKHYELHMVDEVESADGSDYVWYVGESGEDEWEQYGLVC